MSENFKPEIPSPNPDEREVIEGKIENLRAAFDLAESVFKTEGRDKAKEYLPDIYNTLIALNKVDKGEVINPLAKWNPDGDLTEEEFNVLNLRRKILSNVIGILTSSGEVRHNLNLDAPENLE